LNKKKLLQKIVNNPKNIKFNDFVAIVESFGFIKLRAKGSHIIFFNSLINEMINIQNFKGQAKPYQIKQFLYLVEKYNLEMSE
jgi:hypothetical protein